MSHTGWLLFLAILPVVLILMYVYKKDKEKATIRAIISSIETSTPRKGLSITKLSVRDETGFAKLVFFNQDYIVKSFKSGDTILVFGKVKKDFNGVELSSCEVEQMSNNPKSTCGIMPIYPLTYGLTNKELMGIIKIIFTNEQIVVKNTSGVYVLTPSLNKEFRFDSDWPLNSSHAYILEIDNYDTDYVFLLDFRS